MPRGIIESIFVLILLFLVLDNSFGFARIVGVAGGASTNLIKTLQGR